MFENRQEAHHTLCNGVINDIYWDYNKPMLKKFPWYQRQIKICAIQTLQFSYGKTKYRITEKVSSCKLFYGNELNVIRDSLMLLIINVVGVL